MSGSAEKIKLVIENIRLAIFGLWVLFGLMMMPTSLFDLTNRDVLLNPLGLLSFDNIVLLFGGWVTGKLGKEYFVHNQ